MQIDINTIAQVGKSLTVKRTKGDDDDEIVIATLKFEDATVDRETIDQFCNRPIGWAQMCFYDELGAPHLRMTLAMSKKLQLECTGAIKGNKSGQAIKLKQADLTDIELTLAENGALLAGSLSWEVDGDEVSDLEPLLGRLCTFVATIKDGGQQQLWGSQGVGAQGIN